MNVSAAQKQLSSVDPSQRILLLPHCLRHSETCQARYGKWGLECRQCTAECAINKLSEAAARLGYKGVCIAPGGRLALRYVKESRPGAIVAVACDQELEEGVHGVRRLGGSDSTPPIFVIPLTRDGCIDTEVDTEHAAEVIALGCSAASEGRVEQAHGRSR